MESLTNVGKELLGQLKKQNKKRLLLTLAELELFAKILNQQSLILVREDIAPKFYCNFEKFTKSFLNPGSIGGT